MAGAAKSDSFNRVYQIGRMGFKQANLNAAKLGLPNGALARERRPPASCCENAGFTGTPTIRIAPPVRERRPPVGTARRRRAESRIAKHRDGSRLGTVLIPRGDAPARERRPSSVLPVGARHRNPQGRESPPVDVHAPVGATCRDGTSRRLGSSPPRPCGPLCRPEVYTFPGITFSWGRQLANEWRRRGWVGARPVAGGRRQEEEGGAGSELAEPPLAWWRSSRGASPFFLLPAMKLLPAHPRRRRHPEGRSAAEEARSALPSSPWMGTMLSSCRKQENHVSLFLGPPV